MNRFDTEDVDAIRCAYCDRPFTHEDALALHRGLAHRERLDDTETAEFERARESEETELRKYRLKALGALVVLYFGLLMVYAVVT